jgi:predicted outer membrane protein
MSTSDRDMLIKIRQADLWVGPAGEQAAQRAARPGVRDVGGKLAAEHAQLDAELRGAAARLGLVLPSQPSDAQRVWLGQINSSSPADYDATLVNLVRGADGEMVPLIEGVRSGTQNELVRRVAIDAGRLFARHMSYLESTGLVDYALFAPSTAPATRLASIGGFTVPITLVLFVAAVLVSAAMLRGAGRRRQTAATAGADRTGGLRRFLTRRPAGRGRRREESKLVTTAELIAVLNPASAAPKIPSQRVRARETEERRPPKLNRASGRSPW